MTKILATMAVIALLLPLTYAYLYPGSLALVERRTDSMMSDGTDPAPLPTAYDQILKTWRDSPVRFLYGSIYVDGLDPERGSPQWMPWAERWLALAASNFFPIEQLMTAVVFVLITFNGLAMYALARYLNWNFFIALGSAVAWAFTPFVRARAKVHGSMVGTYHLPLIFLGLSLIVRGRSWRSILGAALCFLFACTTVHYFIVTSLFVSPFFLLYIALLSERTALTRNYLRLGVSLMPALAFLAWNFLSPIPSDIGMARTDSYPKNVGVSDQDDHPFLRIYAAKPLDYFTGDISLQFEPVDANPIREKLNRFVRANLGESNAHERTNGIRWSLWILAALGLWSAFDRSNPSRSAIAFFALFGLFAVWLSFSPDFPFENMGPSRWLHYFVKQVRVPSRAGVMAQFSVLMIAGLWITRAGEVKTPSRWAASARRILHFPFVFVLLMIADYPPLVQSLPMAPVLPRYQSLQREKGPCGVGMYFPYINNYFATMAHYMYSQRLRGSDCKSLNNMTSIPRILFMAQQFPVDERFEQLKTEGTAFADIEADRLVKLAGCVPLSWIVFDSGVAPSWRQQVCHRLGWTLDSDLVCRGPDQYRALANFPEKCL